MLSFVMRKGNLGRPAHAAKAVRAYGVASEHAASIRQIVGSGNVLNSADDMGVYTADWTKTYSGGSLVCFPKSTQEVSEIMKYCNTHRVGVVPQGGNTGLVGGGVGTKRGELIMSMKRMNQILDVDTSAGVLTCEAGCVLEWLNGEVGKHGFVIPLDLGAKGSCMIGGNVATNAGGLRVMKYGSMQGNVLGLEVVLADGTVVDMLRTLRKDNCGIHNKHLFIGSEGALGVITKVSMLLATKPTFSCVLFAKLPAFSQVPALLQSARQRLGDTLTAFEFMDRNSIDVVRRAAPNILHSVDGNALPVAQPAASSTSSTAAATVAHEEGRVGVPGEVAVLLECTGTNIDLDQQRVDTFAEAIVEEGSVADAIISMSSEQEKDLWKIRENLTVCLAQLSQGQNPLYHQPVTQVPGMQVRGRLFKYDLSVRLQDTDELLRRLKERVLQAGFRMKGVPHSTSVWAGKDEYAALLSACELEFCNYGHIADQNIHLNILAGVRCAQSPSAAAAGARRVQVPVPTTGEHAKYRLPVTSITAASAAGASIAAVMVSPAADGGEVVVGIETDSLAAYTAMVRGELNRHIFDLVLEMRGSISAEHGVGVQKAGALAWARSPAELALMRTIKAALDPHNILNPGKLLPEPQCS